VTPANAASLHTAWTFDDPAVSGQSSPGFQASPTVVNGTVYIGSETGDFYALNEASGSVLWKASLGFEQVHTCKQPGSPYGVTATAAVMNDPKTHALTVYVSGGSGYLYALDAATGSTRWKSVIALPSSTQNNYYDWSSPTVVNGHIYIGVSSDCDKPLVRAAVKEYSQATGKLLHTTYTTPSGTVGSSVWSSVAVGPDGVYATTGNSGNGTSGMYDAIVRLDPTTLAVDEYWTIPVSQQISDSDFGGSPTLFTGTIGGTATALVGACNKNGIYYAWRADDVAAGPVWQLKLGTQAQGFPGCLAAAAWDGTHLYTAGVSSSSGQGTIRELDPSTGTALWSTTVTGVPLGSPTLDAAGVLADPVVSTGSVPGVVLLNASTGSILDTVGAGSEFAQPVFADNDIFAAAQRGALLALTPS
jgi:polyvinyl alcohol dehydrogenase (cytochrome)